MVGRYTDQDYDSEFIQVLQTQCFKFIKQEGDPTLEDVSTFIHEKVSAMLVAFRHLVNQATLALQVTKQLMLAAGHLACTAS